MQCGANNKIRAAAPHTYRSPVLLFIVSEMGLSLLLCESHASSFARTGVSTVAVNDSLRAFLICPWYNGQAVSFTVVAVRRPLLGRVIRPAYSVRCVTWTVQLLINALTAEVEYWSAKCPVMRAVSMGRRNTSAESTCASLKGYSRSRASNRTEHCPG
jgi:hypothetical protein